MMKTRHMTLDPSPNANQARGGYLTSRWGFSSGGA